MLQEVSITEQDDLVINIGPQHPSTHGVLHLVITLNGETIKKVEPHLGYIHRSIEKMCESLTYRQFIYITSRMDYLSAHMNNHACAMNVEKAMQIEVPQRAQVIRVLMDELTRIASHLLWWGALAMDTGAITPFFHAFRARSAQRPDGRNLWCPTDHELQRAGWGDGRPAHELSEKSTRVH